MLTSSHKHFCPFKKILPIFYPVHYYMYAKKKRKRRKNLPLWQNTYMYFSNTKTLKFNKNHFLNKHFNITFNLVHNYLHNAQLTNNWNNKITGVKLSQYTVYRLSFTPL